MAEAKTKPTAASVSAFIDGIDHDVRRADAKVLLKLMKTLTRKRPKLWGPTLIGFGAYKYEYESGHKGESFRVGFSPRKANLVVYIMPGFSNYSTLLAKLGKHKLGKSCLYINKLADVDMDVLQTLIQASWDHMNDKYG